MSRLTPLSHLLLSDRHANSVVAIDGEGTPLHWETWVRQIAAIQRQLSAHETGTQQQAAWGVYCEDAANAGAALFALWHHGAVAWLPGNATPETVAAVEAGIVGWISDIRFDTSKPVISPDMAGSPAIDTIASDISTPVSPLWQPLPVDQPLLHVFTSGSTGEPKAIPKRLSQLQAEIDNLHALWGELIQTGNLIASVSHQHVYGLLFRLLWPLCSGTAFTREAIQYPEQWFAISQRQKKVTWVASPALYKRLQALLPWSELRHHVIRMFCSGGPLPEENAQFLAIQMQQPVIEVFGSSETGGVGWREATDANAPWAPFAGIDLSTSEEGALRVQSPYLGDATPFEMGDCVDLSPDGHFLLRGRRDRIVKIEEKRVSLPQLEQHLLQHPWVKETHLLPLSNERGRQSLGAVVVLRHDLPVMTIATRKRLTDSLRQHMTQLCEAVIVPKKWRFVPEMPVNAQGKRTQALMSALFAQAPRLVLPEVLVKESLSTHETRYTLSVPAKLAYFEGHFRQAPILPGVVQVDWAVQLGQACWRLPDTFCDLEVLKFQRVVTPLQLLQLSLRYDTDKQKLYFQLQSSKGTHASGRIVFRASAPEAQEGA